MSNKPQLFSGARGKITVAGNTLAYVTDVSVSYSVNVRAVHTFGALNARSVEPLQTSPVQVTIGRVIPVNTASGDASGQTSLLAQHIEKTIAEMLTADDITVEITDKITNNAIVSVKNCRFAGTSKSMSASQLATERFQLMGIYDAGLNGTENTVPTIGL